MKKGFLGIGLLSRENQIRLGLFGVLLLAFHCVLVGLVLDAPVREYVLHALAAGLAVWALLELNDISIRAAASAGIAAFVNEALIIAEAQASVRYLIPGLLLLGVSVWILERSLSEMRSPRKGSREVDPQTINGLVPQPLNVSSSDQILAVITSLVGAALSLYGLIGADWILTRAIFGLFRQTYSFQELRLVWQDLGAPDVVGEAFLGGGQLLAYASLLVVGLAVISVLSRGFVVSGSWRAALVAIVAGATVCNLLVVVSLITASSKIVVLGGAWLLPVGLAISTYGVWSSTTR